MRRASGRTVFWLLVCGCGAAVFCPIDVGRPLRGAFQFIAAPGQKLGHAVLLAATEQARKLSEGGLGAEEARQLREELEAYKRISQRLQCERDELMDRLQQVAGLREGLWRGQPEQRRRALLGQIVRTIPAGLYGRDAAALRDTAILDAGANRSILPGRWATTLRFIDRGEFGDMKKDLPVLAHDALAGTMLVGRIDQVYFAQSRVRLITDIDSRIHARIYHGQPDRGYRRGPTCLVVGTGSGRMSVPRMVVDSAHPIRKGDLVVTRAGEPLLPPSVPIGTVTRCEPRQDNPLLYDIQVTPLADLGGVDRVLIVEMGPPRPDGH